MRETSCISFETVTLAHFCCYVEVKKNEKLQLGEKSYYHSPLSCTELCYHKIDEKIM